MPSKCISLPLSGASLFDTFSPAKTLSVILYPLSNSTFSPAFNFVALLLPSKLYVSVRTILVPTPDTSNILFVYALFVVLKNIIKSLFSNSTGVTCSQNSKFSPCVGLRSSPCAFTHSQYVITRLGVDPLVTLTFSPKSYPCPNTHSVVNPIGNTLKSV